MEGLEKIYTVKELMELLKVGRLTLYNYIKGGQLHGFKVGQNWRFTEKEVQRFLNEGIEKNYTEKLKNSTAEK